MSKKILRFNVFVSTVMNLRLKQLKQSIVLTYVIVGLTKQI